MNSAEEKVNREITPSLVILLTIFFPETTFLNLSLNSYSQSLPLSCLSKTNTEPSSHQSMLFLRMMTKGSQFSCLTAYSTPTAFRDLLRSTLPDFMASNILRWKREWVRKTGRERVREVSWKVEWDSLLSISIEVTFMKKKTLSSGRFGDFQRGIQSMKPFVVGLERSPTRATKLAPCLLVWNV